MSDASPLPLARRKRDIALIVYFAINFVFITYIANIEQLIIDDPRDFTYPIWPPRVFIDMNHEFALKHDPVLLAREAWFRSLIWIDALFFGPFYAAAVYAYARGREWIRLPSIMWASMMMSHVFTVLFEEMVGAHAAPDPMLVLATNAPWALVPPLVVWRMWRPNPFAPRT